VQPRKANASSEQANQYQETTLFMGGSSVLTRMLKSRAGLPRGIQDLSLAALFNRRLGLKLFTEQPSLIVKPWWTILSTFII